MTRCPLTDLLPAQCGCKDHRNSPNVGDVDFADYRIRSRFDAKYDGRCALDPAHPVSIGDPAAFVVAVGSTDLILACAACTVKIGAAS